MIDLGTTLFSLDAPIMARDEFEAYSTRLFDAWDARLAGELILPDYSLILELEEGSVEGVGTVKAIVGALATAVIAYGGLVSGLEIIGKQVRAAGDYLVERAAEPFARLNLQPQVRRRAGKLGQLQRILAKVQRRELTTEEALSEIEAILGEDIIESPELLRILGTALRDIQRRPQQLSLPMELPEELPPETPAPTNLGAPVRKKPKALPPRQQWRVELWRESKAGKRQIRITEM